jgi:hypothetical protein
VIIDRTLSPQFAGEAAAFAGDPIRVFVNHSMSANVRGAVSTIVHESSHITRRARGFMVNSIDDEFRAIRRERFYQLGRRLTLQETAHVRALAKARYSHLPAK